MTRSNDSMEKPPVRRRPPPFQNDSNAEATRASRSLAASPVVPTPVHANTFDGDELGYGKPPKKHQFKKGQSGNAKGRPRKDRSDGPSLRAVLKAELEQLIEITEGAKAKKVTQTNVLVKSLTRKAMKGDNPAIKTLIAILGADDTPARSTGPAQGMPGGQPDQGFSIVEADILEQYRLQCIAEYQMGKKSK